MDDKEQVIKHLEITQGVVNRLAQNSFMIKGWSMTILAAAILFIAKSDNYPEYFLASFVIPVISFWILDGYFLWQERIFRGIYNDVRVKDKTDFKMDVLPQQKKPGIKWLSAIFSTTLILFYLSELFFLLAAYIVMRCY